MSYTQVSPGESFEEYESRVLAIIQEDGVKTAALSDHSKDLEQWQKWRSTRDPVDLNNLYKQMDPLIKKSVSNWRGTLAEPVLDAEAKLLAYKAFDSYTPGRAALSTHVVNNLQKLSRINYQGQNAARIPEHRQIKYRTFTNATEDLTDRLGREPNVAELSQNLAWNPKEVSRFQREIRNELSDSSPVTGFATVTDADAAVVDYLYFDASPTEKLIMENLMGYGSRKPISVKELAAKSHMNEQQIYYEKKKLVDKMSKELGRRAS